MSADVTAAEHVADLLATARSCLDQIPADADPDETQRWLHAAVNWAARALSWTERIPHPQQRAEQETEARTLLVRAAVRLAHAEATSTGRRCCPDVEELHRQLAAQFNGADGWAGGDVVQLLNDWFAARSLPLPD
ncbi:hypothetical protein [Streptacidiphilus monticola]|uniref:Uncharacterized protein n=1 Tax=Streptacidiphilus monticola TaxID=2161674 RepID=A0ABW1GBS3_9ACTN